MRNKIKSFFTWRKRLVVLLSKVENYFDVKDKYLPAIDHVENALYFKGKIICVTDKNNNVLNVGKCISVSALVSDDMIDGFKIKHFMILEIGHSNEAITIDDTMSIKVL